MSNQQWNDDQALGERMLQRELTEQRKQHEELESLRKFVQEVRRHQHGECHGLGPADCLEYIYLALEGHDLHMRHDLGRKT